MTAPLYKSYVFRTKDPAIDELRTVIEDHFGRRMKAADLAEIRDAGGPSTAAMRAWFFGKTLRPTNPTLEAAGRAIGYRRIWQKMNGKHR